MAPTPTISAMTLGLGLTANAWFFFGNLAEALMGPASIISSPEQRKRYGLGAGKSSEMFKKFYYYAAPRLGGASAVTAVSYLTTAYLRRNDLMTSQLSNSLLTTAGILALFPLPWTPLIMMPTNKSIIAKASRSINGEEEVNSEKNLAEFDREIQKWVNLNFIRYSVLGVSYFTALYSLLI